MTNERRTWIGSVSVSAFLRAVGALIVASRKMTGLARRADLYLRRCARHEPDPSHVPGQPIDPSVHEPAETLAATACAFPRRSSGSTSRSATTFHSRPPDRMSARDGSRVVLDPTVQKAGPRERESVRVSLQPARQPLGLPLDLPAVLAVPADGTEVMHHSLNVPGPRLAHADQRPVAPTIPRRADVNRRTDRAGASVFQAQAESGRVRPRGSVVPVSDIADGRSQRFIPAMTERVDFLTPVNIAGSPYGEADPTGQVVSPQHGIAERTEASGGAVASLGSMLPAQPRPDRLAPIAFGVPGGRQGSVTPQQFRTVAQPSEQDAGTGDRGGLSRDRNIGRGIEQILLATKSSSSRGTRIAFATLALLLLGACNTQLRADDSLSKIEALFQQAKTRRATTEDLPRGDAQTGFICSLLPESVTMAASKSGECPSGRMASRNSFTGTYDSRLRKLVEAMGFRMDRFLAVADPVDGEFSRTTTNAYAQRCRDERGAMLKAVAWSSAFMERIEKDAGTPWGPVAILGHEIGHHVNDDMWQGNLSKEERHKQELHADRWAGFALAQLGASKEDAVAAFALLSSKSSDSHPAASTRVRWAGKGWEEGRSMSRKPEPPVTVKRRKPEPPVVKDPDPPVTVKRRRIRRITDPPPPPPNYGTHCVVGYDSCVLVVQGPRGGPCVCPSWWGYLPGVIQ